MSSLRDSTGKVPATRNNSDEEHNGFRRRVFMDKKWRMPRRYTIAIMLCLALLLQTWRFQNVLSILVEVLITKDFHILYPAMGNWTIADISEYSNGLIIGETCAQIPAALLIFLTSSHKFLTVSLALSSVLHMLTPIALQHHSWTLFLVLFSQGIALAPIKVAALSMWKEWAPPSERTRLIILAFSGSYIFAAFPGLHFLLAQLLSTKNNFYLSGVCGLVWSLFWYATISEKPRNDPFISEDECLYLQNNIPVTGDETSSLLKVPWKNIFSSSPIWTLSLVYFKVAFSISVITISTFSYTISLTISNYNPLNIFIAFLILYILMLLVSAILGDYISNKFRRNILNVRRGFLCGAFTLHAVILLGIIFPNIFVKISFFCLSYMVFLLSIPGYITIALDLSSRYVSIVGGIIETFFSSGALCVHYVLDYLLIHHEFDQFEWLFLFDGLLAILVAGIFFKWASAEEQLWSLTFATTRGITDYQRYPSPEDEDDLKLVTETV